MPKLTANAGLPCNRQGCDGRMIYFTSTHPEKAVVNGNGETEFVEESKIIRIRACTKCHYHCKTSETFIGEPWQSSPPRQGNAVSG